MLFLRRLAIAICLTSITMANAAESEIVRDANAAAEWVATALSSSGYKADFTLDSLKEIDGFFDDQAPGGNPKPGGLLSENLGARLFALGAYVGEVIRRQGGEQWQGDDADPEAEINLVIQLKSGSKFWPVQRVMKRFKNGPEDSIYPYGVLLLRP
jgi:hypothetical protein